MKRQVPYKRQVMSIRYSDPGSIDEKVVQLHRVINTTNASRNRQLPAFSLLPNVFGKPSVSSLSDRISIGIDCDEVYPNIFVGDAGSAKNKGFLKIVGITHVVNAAEGNGFTMVSTGSLYYADVGIKYMGIHIQDIPQAQISAHFYECANFIDRAIHEGGRVLVHCLVGISRSASIVIAYLMIKKHMSAEEALRTVRRHREVRPNDGFLRQLLALEAKLSRE